jgi:UDP-N-acetylmuramoyl-L-alanyl-D-glutamate--2,6-diaminopimelate ligase
VEFTVDGVDIDKEEFFGHSSTMTTPDVEGLYRALAFARDAGCDTFVMEASSHALAARRLDGMKVDAGAFTNLSSEHLDRHGDMESYFRAKSSLADLSDIFIVNCDDKYGMRMFDSCINSFGVSADKDLIGKMAGRLFASAENVSLLADGVEYDFYYEGGCARIFSPTPGRFALYNTLLAASIALSLGVSPGSISGALQTFRGAPGRMERISGGAGVPEVLIDYAHTPDALEKAMRDVRETHNGRRLIVLFGCGGDRDKSKRALMGRAAGRLADTVIITGDNPRGEDPDAIIEDILKGVAGSNVKVIPDREEALCFAVEISSERDVILCCGKGHEKYIIDKCGKHYFDEKAILTRELQRKYGKDYKKSL